MGTVKTTIYLDAVEYRRLKGLAAAQGRSAAELIRDAVAEYTASRTDRRLPSSLGVGTSNDGRLSERAEELLAGFGDEP